MTSTMSDLLDPLICSCFSSSSSRHNLICTRLKWSTISIIMALLLIIIYATSGLYTLIDVMMIMSMESHTGNETICWPIFASPIPILLSWLLLIVYFTTVLLTIILLCGIQFNKPWLIFLWSIVMIIMLLLDGITTILALRQYRKRICQTSMQMKILVIIMIVRLILSIFGIFITVFHFRSLSKAKSDYLTRQRMLFSYNNESTSVSCNNSWSRSVGQFNSAKNLNDDHSIPDIPQAITLPRANLATIQRHRTSMSFQTRNFQNKQTDSNDPVQQLPLANDEYNEDFPLTIRLKDRDQDFN